MHYDDSNSTMLDIASLDESPAEVDFQEIVGRSTPLRRVLQLVETVAAGNSTVLLLGETGTGKELIARALHNQSPREKPHTGKTELRRYSERAARE
jgi:transcriptional regulator with GAF, ATPase, and Fis domain